MLVVVEPGAAGKEREPHQQVGQRVACDLRQAAPCSLDLVDERNKTPRLDVSECILLETPEIEPEFEQVVSAREGRIVHGLEGISHAVLRVVEFVSERGETRNRDEAQAEVPR